MRGLVGGLLAFAVYFVIQVAIFHSVKVSRRALVLVGIWVAGLPVYALIYFVLPDDGVVWPGPFVAPSDGLTFFSGGLLYFFIFMGYAQFIYMAESSVGVRTMIELATNTEKGLTLEELTGRYRQDWMLGRRLARMVHAGYLVEEDGRYRVTGRGRFVATVLAYCKRILCLGPGG